MKRIFPGQKKWVLTGVFLILAALALSPLAEKTQELPLLAKMDENARDIFDSTLERAVATFALVRGINGIVSVLQGTELAVSPAGIGMQLSVGEILDPVNDLVERFSWVMLVSCTAIGIQRLLMEVGNWLGTGPLLSLSMLLFALSLWREKLFARSLRSTAGSFLIFALVVRFFVPLSAVISEHLYNRFLAVHYADASASLQQIGEQLEQKTPVDLPDETNLNREGGVDRWKRRIRESTELMDWERTFSRLKSVLSDMTAYAIRLIVVFLLQTILFPLIFLWLLIRIGRHLGHQGMNVS